MSDPHDDELNPTPAGPSSEGQGDDSGALTADQLMALVSGREERSGGRLAGKGRPALNDSIARRWDPAKLVRSVSHSGGAGEALDHTTRHHFERKLGVDLGDVRVYSGDFAKQVTRQHQAEAVTIGGTGMIFMSGTPDRSPATAAGKALLAHELTHVAQASRGLYRSAPGQSAPLATEEHEAEAEQMEASELAEASSSSDDSDEMAQGRADEMLLDKVCSRVMDMVYEDERVSRIRNGDR